MDEEDDPERDPDYELSESAKHQKKLHEDVEKAQTITKIKAVIRREFQIELEFREKQLEMIQQRITKAAKSMHLLRYCLITGYYNKNELKTTHHCKEEDPIGDSQSRIHPAVKRLLGNNSIEVYNNLGLRKKRNIQEEEIEIKKEVVIPEEKEDCENETKIETETVNLIRNRKLFKHQIVVGNISKWAPSGSSEDSSTHKWMVYVRGPREFPDISHIVKKVVFYLHPSYKPNDVIEVSKSPFHLARRGWGEFPLRIQLSFHGDLNKPVDVIHNLKLDRTHTGRQTLGNETIIEVSLYDMTKGDSVRKRNGFREPPAIEIKQEIIEEEPKPNLIIPEKVPEDPKTSVNLDHNYCQKDEVPLDQTNESESKNKRRLSYSALTNSALNKRIKTEFFEDPEDDVDVEKYRIDLDSYRLKNLDQALAVLFKKLPLVSELAGYGSYKWMYPFTACSKMEFESWNVAKQFSSEWARAYLIRKTLQKSQFPGSRTLKTKSVLRYGRAHGFAHPLTYDVYFSLHDQQFDYERHKVAERDATSSTQPRDVQIDVINHHQQQSTTRSKREDGILIKWTDNFKSERSFVKQAALDVGVVLKQEQIIPGVLYSTTERIIYECVKGFAEDLIRRSLCWAVTNERFNRDSFLMPSHIVEGLHHREEFERILSFNKDTLQY